MREAIVLAGGLGTRLAAAVPDLPKALADVAGRPFLAWQLDYLCANGFRRVVIAVGYRREQIVATIGRQFGTLDVDYAEETSPLGTGGAIRHALSRVRDAGVHVFNGDTLVALNLRDLRGRGGERLVMAGVHVVDAARYGALDIDGDRVVGFAEKGSSGAAYVNTGTYWLSRDLFDACALPERFSFEEQFLRSHAARVRPRVVRATGPMIDIGVPDSLADAQRVVPDIVRSARLQPQ